MLNPGGEKQVIKGTQSRQGGSFRMVSSGPGLLRGTGWEYNSNWNVVLLIRMAWVSGVIGPHSWEAKRSELPALETQFCPLVSV